MTFTEDQKAQLTTDGFIVLPRLLTPEAITRIREVTKVHLEKKAVFGDGGITQMDAFNEIPELRWLATYSRVLAAFRFFCGEALEYCHHSDVHMNKFTGWHRDNHGHDDWRTGDGDATFGVYKMAAYLQDHTQGPTALFVVRGSHLTNKITQDEIVELRPAIGDVILFDTRIRHKGEENDLFGKVLKRVSPSQALTTRILQAKRAIDGKRNKMSVFFTYGLPNEFTREHIDITVDRQLQQSGDTSYRLDAGLHKQLVEAGILVRNVRR